MAHLARAEVVAGLVAVRDVDVAVTVLHGLDHLVGLLERVLSRALQFQL